MGVAGDFRGDIIVHNDEELLEKVASFFLPSEAFKAAKNSSEDIDGHFFVIYFKRNTTFPSSLNMSNV